MKELEVFRVDGEDPNFRQLVSLLDEELKERDGDLNDFYHPYNGLDEIHHVVMIYLEGKAIGCGAVKHFDDTSAEIKRMYTVPEYRGHRIAAMILNELERWTVDLGYIRCVLETGKGQPEAIKLYERSGYKRTPNFAPYEKVENSMCFEKLL